jgi:transposase
VQGCHPLQTTDALGAASTHLGPHAVALIVLLAKQLGLSRGKAAALLRDWFGLHVRPSGITHAVHRAARQAGPTYAALCDQVRGSPVVSPDTLDATNWRAEQAPRPAIVNRKVSGENRSSHGAETQQILSSVVQTARLRDSTR